MRAQAAAEVQLLAEERGETEPLLRDCDEAGKEEEAAEGPGAKECSDLRDDAGMQGVDCSVCMCRPVQVLPY